MQLGGRRDCVCRGQLACNGLNEKVFYLPWRKEDDQKLKPTQVDWNKMGDNNMLLTANGSDPPPAFVMPRYSWLYATNIRSCAPYHY